MDKEIWKPIVGVIGPRVEVSNYGRVRQKIKIIKGIEVYDHVIKTYTSEDGNANVRFRQGDKQQLRAVRKLVALAFVDNPNGYEHVGYIDPEAIDLDHADNLEWREHRENPVIDEDAQERYAEIRRRRKAGERPGALAKEFGCHPSLITRVCKGL